jgi:hypothetical protein
MNCVDSDVSHRRRKRVRHVGTNNAINLTFLTEMQSLVTVRSSCLLQPQAKTAITQTIKAVRIRLLSLYHTHL